MYIEAATPGAAPPRLLSPGGATRQPLSFGGFGEKNKSKRFSYAERAKPPRPGPGLPPSDGAGAVGMGWRSRTRPGGTKLLSNSKAIRMSAKKVLTRALSVIM